MNSWAVMKSWGNRAHRAHSFASKPGRTAPVLLVPCINLVARMYIPFLTCVRDRASKRKVISIYDRIFDGRRGPTRDNAASWRCAVPVPWRCTDKYRGSLKAETQRSLLRLLFQAGWETERARGALLLADFLATVKPKWVWLQQRPESPMHENTRCSQKSCFSGISRRKLVEFMWVLNVLCRHTYLLLP